MSASIKLTNIETLRPYIEQFRPEVVEQMFTDFEANDFSTGLDGIKGKAYIPKMLVGELATRWSLPFTPMADAIMYDFDTIETVRSKVDLMIYPSDFDANMFVNRKKGQGMDIPQEQVIFGRISKSLKQQIGTSFWLADKTATPLATDKLGKLFDGMKKIFLQRAQQGKIEVVPIPNGAYDIDNIIPHFKQMQLKMGAAYSKGTANVFLVGPEVKTLYFDAIVKKAPNRNPVTQTVNGIQYLQTFDGSAWMAVQNDLRNTEFVTYLSPGFMFYAVDAFSDTSTFDIQKQDRGWKFLMDFMYGVQLVVPEPYAVVYNGK
jgi:hypothetical protein